MILYLHGFASDGKNEKAKILKKYFTNETVVSPTLPADPIKAIYVINKTIAKYPDEQVFIIGTSLGAFYALYTYIKKDIPVILINPSLFPSHRLSNIAGGKMQRFNTKKIFIWKHEYAETLKKMEDEIAIHRLHHGINSFYINFLLANDDNIVPNKDMERIFPSSEVKRYNKSGHQFVNFEDAIGDIKQILNKYKNIDVKEYEEI